MLIRQQSSAFMLLCVALLFSGCSLFTPEIRPDAPIELPEQYTFYTASDPGPGNWWKSFGSPELDALVEQSLSGNFDIRVALAKVRQAEASARKTGAELYPTLDYSAGAGKSWQQTKTEGGRKVKTDSETYSLGATAGYELDLWGRLRALKTEDVLEYKATREDLEAASVTVAADVVSAWIDTLSVRQQILILKKQIDLNRKMLKLQEMRFLNAQADALDVSQQQEALASAQAILPTLELKEKQQLSTLAVLLGKAGAGDLKLSQDHLPDLIPLPDAGLPADLLASRPDVRAAGLRLKKADWAVSAARADRLPSLSLSADAVFSSSTLDLLLSNWVTTLAAAVTGPVFDGGARNAEVERARAQADQYLAAYARTVAEAIQEVEDTLITEKQQAEYIRLLKEQLEISRLTVRDAQLQYMNGQNNYLSYLTSWTSVQQLERQLVDEQATLIKNRVALYRALGGNWDRQL